MASPDAIERVYVPMWTNALQYAGQDTQEIAMTALRTIGHECVAEGHGEEFIWLWRPPGKEVWCLIDPLGKPQRYDKVEDHVRLTALIDELDEALGSGVWLEPNDYEALRERYNILAQAAEDVVTVYRLSNP